MLIGPFQFPTEDQDLTITVQTIHQQGPDPGADNPADYHGFLEVEYEAEDEAGRRYAPTWHEDKAITEEIMRRQAAEDEEAAIAAADVDAEFRGGR